MTSTRCSIRRSKRCSTAAKDDSSRRHTIYPHKLSATTKSLLEDSDQTLFFSAVSLWEIVIKQAKGLADFQVDAAALRHRLLEIGFIELPVTSRHVLAVSSLPPLHKDPFDRPLLAQATTESLTLLTADAKLTAYPGLILRA